MIRKAAGIAAILVVIFVIAIIAKANPVHPQPVVPGPQDVQVCTPGPDQPFGMPVDGPGTPAANSATAVFAHPSSAPQVSFDSPEFTVFPKFVVANEPAPGEHPSPSPLVAFVPFEGPFFGGNDLPV
jgi:hypothetical protein